MNRTFFSLLLKLFEVIIGTVSVVPVIVIMLVLYAYHTVCAALEKAAGVSTARMRTASTIW